MILLKKGLKINFSIKDIYQATSGRNRIDNDFLNRKFNKIKINSQKIKKDDLFIAIKGLNFDGHDFIDEAFTNGAVAALISDKKRVYSNTILVNDTKKSLGDIATLILKKTSPFITAITGSNGKTTTKEIINSILVSNFGQNKTLATQGNFNNDIGLPLTIFNLNKTHTHLTLEMGMNHANEIDYLAKIAPPNIAVITNIDYLCFASTNPVSRNDYFKILNTQRVKTLPILSNDFDDCSGIATSSVKIIPDPNYSFPDTTINQFGELVSK